MAKDNSSDQCEEVNSSDDEREKDNSSDHENENENSSDHECEQEQENSSDDESKKEIYESEKDNSCDDERKKDNCSDDESEEYNPKAGENKKSQEVVIKKRKIVEEDDTEETLKLLLEKIKNGESKISPPVRIDECVVGIAIYTKCIYKQLTESDVNGGQSRLMLGKKQVKDHFICHLEEYEIPGVEGGVDVLVYGPDGESHKMKFKMWNKNTPVLMNGWSKFVKDYKLQKYSDVLTIWMFRASQDRQICFAIDHTRFDDITKQLSKRIMKTVFK